MCSGSLEELIKKRRSIRRYKDIVPPEEWIEQILQCALWAPSPSNIQPVRYLRIVSEDIRKKLHNSMYQGKERLIKKWQELRASKRLRNWIDVYYHKYSEFMFNAPVIFAVGVIKKMNGFFEKLKKSGIISNNNEDHGLDISLGLSISNFILKAEELGLGTCILTTPLIFIDDINKVLDIRDTDIRCFITLGFPSEGPIPPERLSLSEIYKKI